MTLILAIATEEGAVLASDGQVTAGAVRASGQKIFRLNDHCAWAGAGEVALVQRVGEAIGAVSTDQPLVNLRDQLANAIRQCVTALLQLDFRTQFFQGNPEALLSLHHGDFVFVECRSRPAILHITSYGTPEWIDRPYAAGNGDLFAYALLQKYQGLPLTLEQATVLATKVLQEAIAVGAYGLGAPIHLWHILSDGIRVLEEAQIATAVDAAESLRRAEIAMLVGPGAEEEVAPAG